MFQLPRLLLKARKLQSTWMRQGANAGEFPLGTKCCFFHSQSCDEFASRRSTAFEITHSKLCVWVLFFLFTPFTLAFQRRADANRLVGLGCVLLFWTFFLESGARAACLLWEQRCPTPRQPQTLFLALWSSLASHIIGLNDLIVGGKFKCAILITCYPRQIKSLCVKSTLLWITYKTSIYWINVGSNFILMWLTVCFSPLEWDKNTQTYNCVATLHLTCLFLLLSF